MKYIQRGTKTKTLALVFGLFLSLTLLLNLGIGGARAQDSTPKEPTNLEISSSATRVDWRDNVELTATLTSNGNPLPGKTIKWSATKLNDKGLSTGSFVPESTSTNKNGKATTKFIPPDNDEVVRITASFQDSQKYEKSSDDKILNIIISLEVTIDNFRFKEDVDTGPLNVNAKPWVGDPFFKLTTLRNQYTLPPTGGNGENIYRIKETNKSYPGPLFDSIRLGEDFIEIEAMDYDPLPMDSNEWLGKIKFENPNLQDMPLTKEFEGDNFYFKVTVRPTSPYDVTNPYSPVAGLTFQNTSQLSNSWHWFATGADNIWKNYTKDNFDNVVVAVVGTGVDYRHRALEDKIWHNSGEMGMDSQGNDKRWNGIDDDGNGYKDDWRGWNFVEGNNNPMDKANHGTMVAEMISSSPIDGETVGIASVMGEKVKIMPVKTGALGFQFGPWKGVVDETIAEGIEYARKNGADIINLSLGMFPPKQTLRDFYLREGFQALLNYLTKRNLGSMIEKAHIAKEDDVLVIASAGNENTLRPLFPAASPDVISVSGLRKTDTEQLGVSKFSNYGSSLNKESWSVEFSMPGSEIIATARNNNNPGYTPYTTNGTSFSAPCLSAVAGLVKGYAKDKGLNLEPDKLREILQKAVVDLGPDGWDPWYGHGMVRADLALEKTEEYIQSVRADLDLNVKTPSSSNPIFIGSENEPVSFITKLSTGLPVQLDSEDFEVKINGNPTNFFMVKKPVDPAEGEYWLQVSPPQQTYPGRYDFEISVENEDLEISDEVSVDDAVVYRERRKADVMLVLDRSGSMGGAKIADAKDAAKEFIDLQSVGDMVGVASYSDYATKDFPLMEIPPSTITPNSETVNVESPHPYSNNSDNVWSLHKGGAAWVRVHFDYIDTEAGYDYIYVNDEGGATYNQYDGYHSGEWSDWIQGDTVKVRLTSDSSNTADGFHVDKLEWTTGENPPIDVKEEAKKTVEYLYADGNTNIGGGLREGLNELTSASSPEHKRAMLLLSDGKHNEGEDPKNVLPEVKNNNIQVYSVGLGQNADENLLDYIARETEGEYYSSPNPLELKKIYNIISGAVKNKSTLKSQEGGLQEGESITHDVNVDDTVSTSTFTLSWNAGDLDFELFRPDGSKVNPNDSDVSAHIEGSTYETYTIDVKNQTGAWEMEITALTTHSEALYSASVRAYTGLNIETFTEKEKYSFNEPMQIINTLAVEGNPVTGADVSATIEKPNGNEEELTLYDDGEHADGSDSDGVYSNYYTQADVSGTYTIRVEASGTRKSNFFTRESTTTVLMSSTPSVTVSPTPASCSLETGSGAEIITPITVQSSSIKDEMVNVSSTDLEDSAGHIISFKNLESFPTKLTIPAGENTTFYESMNIPENTELGVYEGEIILKSTSNSVNIPTKVQVLMTEPSLENVTTSSLSLHSDYILGDFSSGNVYFQYRQKEGGAWENTSGTTYTTEGVHEDNLENLESDTVYEIRTVLKSEDKAVYGSSQTFATAKIPARIKSSGVVETGSDYAKVNVEVILNDYENADLFICYGNQKEFYGTVQSSDNYSYRIKDLQFFNEYEWNPKIEFGDISDRGKEKKFKTEIPILWLLCGGAAIAAIVGIAAFLLRRRRRREKMDDLKKNLVELASEGEISVEQASEEFDVSEDDLEEALKELREEGVIK